MNKLMCVIHWFRLFMIIYSCSQAQKVKLILLGTDKPASLKHFYAYINVTQVNIHL